MLKLFFYTEGEALSSNLGTHAVFLSNIKNSNQSGVEVEVLWLYFLFFVQQ